MSQVHNVTHVPVHSPLSEACLPYAARSAGTIRVGVAGSNGLGISVSERNASFLMQRLWFNAWIRWNTFESERVSKRTCGGINGASCVRHTQGSCDGEIVLGDYAWRISASTPRSLSASHVSGICGCRALL